MTTRPEDDKPQSLFEHLAELRSRLLRITLAILVLGVLALTFARPLFHFLVQPILAALPEGERTLIQTSAVEEINTLLKVGLYAGLFFSAPVVLHQIWGFVSPGLYANERRMAVPFIVAGSLCFGAGAAFCYFAVLPPAFGFLLKPQELRAQRTQLELGRAHLDDATWLLRVGELTSAEQALEQAETELRALPAAPALDGNALVERTTRLDPILDAAARATASAGAGQTELTQALEARGRARVAALQDELVLAREELAKAERAAQAALGRAEGGARAVLLWARQQEAVGRLASASHQLSIDDWTRPMLSMKEQLNLVLVLLLAFAVIFEIPVLFALLAAVGLVTGEKLAKWRRYAIVGNVIVAAVLTPTGDPFNLAMMAIPMMLCYEAGILAARLITKRRRRREEAAIAGL